MAYSDRIRKTLTGRAGDWLSRNSWPRLVVLATYGLAGLVAYQSSVSLQQLGVENLTTRFALCFVVAYLTYAFVVGCWLLWMPTLEHTSLMQNATPEIQTVCPAESSGDWIEQAAESAKRQVRRDARGVFGFLVMIAILGLFFLLTYWMWYARWYLGELMVLTGKVRHRSVRNVSRDAWVVEPLKQSIWMAIGLLMHFVLLGMVLHIKLV